jgi:AbrB family looped-hinge helix DNA binding protein
MGAVTVKVDASGRVVIPKELREQLGIPEGGELRLSVEDGELRGATRLAALRRIQRRMAELVPPGVSLVDELIADRRAEAAREAARDATREADVAELRRRGVA